MILLIASTASGGHFFPAYNVGLALRYRGVEVKLAVFGEKTYVSDDAWILNFRGVKEFRLYLKKNKSDINLAISFGSRYVVLPSILAKRVIGKLWIHEQNVVPGKANKLLFHFSDKILLSFRGSEPFIPSMFYKKMVVLGYPLNEYISAQCPPAEQLRERWNIPENGKVVVFTGGSKGAVEINVIASNFIRHLHDRNIRNVYVIWQRGGDDMLVYGDRGVTFGFTSNLYCIFQVADLIISRAGAGTLAEIISLGKKALVVPLRGVAGDHQYFNAVYSGFPVHRVDSLIFDTIYDALFSEDNDERVVGNLELMNYDELMRLIGGRERV